MERKLKFVNKDKKAGGRLTARIKRKKGKFGEKIILKGGNNVKRVKEGTKRI